VLPVGYSYDIITLSITLKKKSIKKYIQETINNFGPKNNYKGIIEIYRNKIITSRIHTNTKSITGLNFGKTTF